MGNKTTRPTAALKARFASSPLAPKPTEKTIQQAVMRRLQAHDFIVVRVNSSAMKSPSGNYLAAYHIAGLGVSAGFPDVLALRSRGNGVEALLVEIKDHKGRLSDSQKKFHEWAAARGVAVHVVRHPDELDAILAALTP